MSGVMPAEQKGAIMPREQLNTAARRVVREYDDGTGKILAVYNIMQDGEEFPTDSNVHIEHTPLIYLGWVKGKSGAHEGSLDSGYATFTIAVAEEEILREAEAIKFRQEMSRAEALEAGLVPPGGGWTSRMTEFTSVVLTRQELNDMVRTARRARNAVYGQDE